MAKQTRNLRDSVTSRLRLRNYDYATPAYYFVSICCQNRAAMFGNISGEHVNLNPAGVMVDRIWDELPSGFLGITIDSKIVMPNHVHILVGVGVHAQDPQDLPSLIDVIHWFKSLTTTRYIQGVNRNLWPRFDGRLWQRGFHDHIVRNERELQIVREYIVQNPARWDEDTWRD